MELLVTVAVIAILIGLLLPALGSARHAAKQAACAAMQRSLAQALLGYGSENDDWIPGFNTSGRHLWTPPSPLDAAVFSRHEHAPVQTNDWMSPILKDAGLPRNREHRFYTLLDRFACPEMTLRVPAWGTGADSGASRMTDWIEEKGIEPARGISYMMPTNFQLFGGPRIAGDPIITQHSSSRLSLLSRIHFLRPDYQPKLTMVGSASRKAAFADGFRYLSSTTIDFDASFSHQNWGSFGERSPCDVDSRAWGRKGGGGTGLNIPVSYRHDREMNIAFFDGHVSSLGLTASRDPVLWAPSGSRVGFGIVYEEDVKLFGYQPGSEGPSVIE